MLSAIFPKHSFHLCDNNRRRTFPPPLAAGHCFLSSWLVLMYKPPVWRVLEASFFYFLTRKTEPKNSHIGLIKVWRTCLKLLVLLMMRVASTRLTEMPGHCVYSLFLHPYYFLFPLIISHFFLRYFLSPLQLAMFILRDAAHKQTIPRSRLKHFLFFKQIKENIRLQILP